MTTVASFRSNYLVRLTVSIETGTSISTIKEEIDNRHGRHEIENLIADWYPEYEGFGDWSAEGLTIECILDYLEAVLKIETITSLQIRTIYNRTITRRSDAHVRNLQRVNSHWYGTAARKYDLENIQVRHIRMLYEKISELNDYLAEFIPDRKERSAKNLIQRFKELNKNSIIEEIYSSSAATPISKTEIHERITEKIIKSIGEHYPILAKRHYLTR